MERWVYERENWRIGKTRRNMYRTLRALSFGVLKAAWYASTSREPSKP